MSGEQILARLVRGQYTRLRVNGRMREIHACEQVTGTWVLTLRNGTRVPMSQAVAA